MRSAMHRQEHRATSHVEIADRIRTRLRSERWSGRSAAVELGWGTAYMSRRLSGEIPFDVADLLAIGNLLGVSAGTFFAETQNTPSTANGEGGAKGLPDLDSNQEPAGSQSAAERRGIADLAAWRARRPRGHRQPSATGARITRFPAIVAVA